MSKLDKEAQSKILTLLCEGMSVRAVSRITGSGKNTILRLLVDAGRASADWEAREERQIRLNMAA